jgi:hypothetical protein
MSFFFKPLLFAAVLVTVGDFYAVISVFRRLSQINLGR